MVSITEIKQIHLSFISATTSVEDYKLMELHSSDWQARTYKHSLFQMMEKRFTKESFLHM